MTNTIDSRVIQAIDEILLRAFWALPVSDIEYHYQQRYRKSLDYKGFGVDNITNFFYKLGSEGKVVLLKTPESIEPYVMSVRLAEDKQQGFLKFRVKELLDKHSGDIPFSKFEEYYNAHSKSKWDSYYFGLNDLDQLCDVLKDIVTAEVNSSGEKMMKAVHRDFSPQALVAWEIEAEKALLLRKLESTTTCVMSAVSEERQTGYLKFIVKEILKNYCGEIPFSSFEEIYEDKFKVKWKSHYFGLTDLDQLSDVLKDIVMVEVNSSGKKVMKAVNKDSSGEKVMKAVNKDSSGEKMIDSSGQGAYNLRRRKIESFYDLLHNPNDTFKIDEALEGCPMGIALSDLSDIETSCHLKSPRSIQKLFLKLGQQKKVLLLKKPESKEKYVMSHCVAEWKQKGLLKYIVKELLYEYGQIPFRFFENFYKDKVKVEWNSFDYGLTDLDQLQLCVALEDIVMVEVNSSGKKVMKAVNQDSK